MVDARRRTGRVVSVTPQPRTVPHRTAIRAPRSRRWAASAPGTAAVLVVAAGSLTVSSRVPTLSALLLAIVVGALARNVRAIPTVLEAGITWSSRYLLRLGVVLLGLQLSVREVLALGLSDLGVLAATVAATFAATLVIGRRLRVGRPLRLLIATGFAICGAAAIAAMSPVADADDDDVATAVALVTLYGTGAMLAIPALARLLGLDDETAGLWAGLSVHEVAQVVVAAGAVSAAALSVAVVAKLARVVVLAPLVAGVAVARRRSGALDEGARRPPWMPLFVVGFLVAIGLRSTGAVPEGVLDAARNATTVALAAAMVGLGAQVPLARLARTGGRALALGAASTAVAMVVSLGGLLLVG